MNIEEISIDSIREKAIKKASDNAPKQEFIQDVSLPQPPMPDFPTFGNVTDCDTFLEELHKVKNIFDKDAIKLYPQLAWQAILNELVQMKEAIVQLWNQLKSMVKEIVQEIVDLYRDIIAFFDSELKKVKALFRKLKKATSEEEKQALKEELKKYGKNILEILGIVEMYYTLLGLWQMMKNLWGVAVEGWQKMINNFRSLKEVLSDCDTPLGVKIVTWVDILLPIIATLALTVLAAIDMCKENKKANEKNLEEGLKDIEKPSEITDLSLLLKKAKTKSEEKEENEQEDSSIISICPVETNEESIQLEEEFRYALEVALNYNNFYFTKDVNEEIKLNDIIGYIEGTPIKSKIEGTVIEKKDRHIIVKPFQIDENVSIEVKEDDELNNIIDAFENITKIESVLKDDIIYTYKSILLKNSIYDENATTNYEEKYESMISKFSSETKKMENDIIEICDKSNIEKRLEEENGLLTIKEDIMTVKNNYFSYIFSTIKSNDKKFNSNEKNNYTLCDYYFNFISNFDYDKDNKYKVELFDIVNSFIQDRKKKESFDISKIISKINVIAEEINKEENFFQLKLEENLPKLNLNNIEEIYEYLKKLFSIKNVETSEIKLDLNNINSEEVNNLMNNNSEPALSEDDKNNIANDKKCKKIATLLYIWQECKNNTNNEKTLYEQTLYEYDKLKTFYNKLQEDYKTYNDITNNLESFAEIKWPTNGIIYIDNIEHRHYLFINDAKSSNGLEEEISEEDGNNQLSTKTKYEPTSYMYWLKYCGMASMINCIMPQYWGTGIIIAGVPMMMPIILIPIYVWGKNTIHVLGLGICGIAIYPMLLISNMTGDMYSYLPPVNMVLDMAKEIVDNLKKQTTPQLKMISESQINMYDELIKKTERDIENVKKEMSIIKNL